MKSREFDAKNCQLRLSVYYCDILSADFFQYRYRMLLVLIYVNKVDCLRTQSVQIHCQAFQRQYLCNVKRTKG